MFSENVGVGIVNRTTYRISPANILVDNKLLWDEQEGFLRRYVTIGGHSN